MRVAFDPTIPHTLKNIYMYISVFKFYLDAKDVHLENIGTKNTVPITVTAKMEGRVYVQPANVCVLLVRT